MSLFATTMLDMLFRVSTLKKSTVKMLVKMLGLKSWIFSGTKFKDSLIIRIKRGVGTRGVGAYFSHSNFVQLREKNIVKQG